MSRIPELYPIFLESSCISTDTRRIGKGDIYFALKGASFDGNEFAEQALGKGARLAVVDQPGLGHLKGCFLVDDALLTLQELARHHRLQMGIPVLAITGSNGKTTTKELVVRVLGKKFRVGYTRGNLNNHIGVPLTLLSFDSSTRFGVVEMGANHPGEIAALCTIADPDAGLITNIGAAHLEGFGSPEGVFRAKTELVGYLEKKDGLFFRNKDDKWLARVGGLTREFCYGDTPGSDLHGWLSGESDNLSIGWETGDIAAREVHSPMPGGYNVSNILAAIAVGLYYGVEPEEIDKAISSYVPENNRSQVKDTGRNKLLLDAYNANPSSMEVALKSFAQTDSARPKMIILGDMFELGDTAMQHHQAVADLAAELGFERTWLIGSNFSACEAADDVLRLAETKDAVEYASRECITGWSILIKGSRGMHLEDLISQL